MGPEKLGNREVVKQRRRAYEFHEFVFIHYMKTKHSFGSDIGQVQQGADQNVERAQREIGASLSIVAILSVVAAGTIWGAMVLQLIKLAYDGLSALMRWQTWLHH